MSENKHIFIYDDPPRNIIRKNPDGSGAYLFEDVKIVEVEDGDTVSAVIQGRLWSIRLIGINSAELPKDTDTNEIKQYKKEHNDLWLAKYNKDFSSIEQVEAHALNAKNFLNNMVGGKLVDIDISVRSFQTYPLTDIEIPNEFEFDATGVRLLGVIYTKGRNPYNVNKSLYASNLVELTEYNSGHISTTDWGNLREDKSDFQYYDGAKRHQYEHQIQDFLIVSREGFRDNSINIESGFDVPRMKQRPPGYLRIGDVEFVVPPQAIRVTHQAKTSRIKTLRSTGSIQAKSGYVDTLVELELFFHTSDTINGYQTRSYDNYQYWYINGLRPLIAQFKKTPFLPIINGTLNDIYDIEAVTLANMTAQTVPGFPDCLVVTLSMLKFNYDVYMPYNPSFDTSINWLLFRWFYQGAMNYRGDGKTWLKPVNGRITNDFTLSLADEDQLKNITARIKNVNYGPSDKEIASSSKSTPYGAIDEDGRAALRGRAQKEQYKKYNGYTAKTLPVGSILGQGEDVSDLVWVAGNISYLLNSETHPGYRFSLGDKRGYIIKLYYADSIDEVKAVSDASGVNLKKGYYFIPEDHEYLIDNIISRYNNLRRSIQNDEDERQALARLEEQLILEDVHIPNLHVQSINITMENIISSLQVIKQESPTHQYLGSQDTFIQVRLETDDPDAVALLTRTVKVAENLAREYRIGISTGFLGVKNDVINLFGVQHILVENLTVNTVPNFPDRFEIVLNLVSFNKTQRRGESLNALDIDKGVSSSDDVKALTKSQESIVELKLLDLEVYPDLELPTYYELQDFTRKNGINYNFPDDTLKKINGIWQGPRFVDPDFYIHTRDTFRNALHEEINSTKADPLVLRDHIGTAESLTPNSVDHIQPLYNISESIKRFAEEQISNEKTRFDEGASSVSGAVTGVSSYTPPQIDSDTIGVDDGDKKKYTKHEILKPPTPVEWGKWKGLDVSKDFDMVERAMFNDIGKNPSYKQVSDYIVRQLEERWRPQYGSFDKAVLWVKALFTQESKWQQFNSDGTPKFSDLGSTAVGIAQYISSVNGKSLQEARRIAWDWEYNVLTGIDHFLLKYTDKGLDNKSGDRFEWTIYFYHHGHACGNSPTDKVENCPYGNNRTNSGNHVLAVKNYYDKFKVVVGTASDKVTFRSVTIDQILDIKPVQVKTPQTDYSWGYRATGSPTSTQNSADSEADTTKQLKEIWKRSYADMVQYDHRGRLLRAFPCFQMFIVDEGRWISWLKMWDNFYGFNAIQSIDIVKSRKIAADTAIIRMTNVYQNLTTYNLDLDYGHYDEKYKSHELLFKQFDHRSLIETRKEHVQSLYLRTGARIHLRMGYGSCAADLPVVFNGTITELDSGGDIIDIIAQGDGIELSNPIANSIKMNTGIKKKAEPRSTLLYLMAQHNSPVWSYIMALNGNRNLDEKSLWSLIDRPTNPQGVAHFGNPLECPVGIEWPWSVPGTYATLQESESKTSIYGVPTSLVILGDYDRSSDYSELGLNIYAANGLGTHSQWVHDKYSVSSATGTEAANAWIKWNTDWGIPWADGDEPNIPILLHGKTIWDVAQTFALCVPDYISTVVPFEFRSSLFYGKPYWPQYYKYNWEYKWDTTTQSFQKIGKEVLWKTLSQTHVYMDISDIISNNIKASEDGVVTNVIATYKDDGALMESEIVKADTDIYPEKQKTAIVNFDMDSNDGPFDHRGKKIARTFAAQSLRDFIKDMYKGDLIVIGDPCIKPYDTFYVIDTQNEMNGLAGVKQVVHHFSHETGFVTNICPDALVVVDDKALLSLFSWVGSFASGFTVGTLACWCGIASWKKAMNGNLGRILRTWGDGGNKFATHILREYFESQHGAEVISSFDELRTALSESKLSSIARTIDKAEDIYENSQKIKTIVKLGRGLLKATVPYLAADIALTIIAHNIFEAWTRHLRNMQAVLIIPLTSHGQPLTAGINGHRGCVVGDKPSNNDRFYMGLEGGLGRVAALLNFLSTGSSVVTSLDNSGSGNYDD
jgi:hypothetical protein